MECFIVEKEHVDREAGELRLVSEEAHHALHALRVRAGALLLASDLEGTCYRCKVEEAGRDELRCRIEEVLPGYGEPARDVTLITALLSQPSRWEFLLEKATELGVKTIVPVVTERTERISLRYERSEKILRAAVKQTKRAVLPHLEGSSGELSSLEAALSEAARNGRTVFLLHEAAPPVATLRNALMETGGAALAVVIGPEGGFSEAEVEQARRMGARIVSLGPRRLRAETAALATLAQVMG